MATDIVSPELKYHVLIGMSILLLIYSRINRIKFKDLGFTKRNLAISLTRVMVPSFLVAICILAIYFLGWFRSDNPPAPWSFYIFYIFISSSLQEFIYRGFLFHLLTQAQVDRLWIILITSGLYGFMHIIFDIPSVIFTFIIGLYWGWVYDKDRNIYSVMASHSILGSLSLLANFS